MAADFLPRLLSGTLFAQPVRYITHAVEPLGQQNVFILGLTSVVAILGTSILVSAAQTVLKGRRLAHIETLWRPFSPFSLPGILFRSNYYLNPGLSFCWRFRDQAYKPFKLELISFIGVLGGYDFVATNSLDVARQIAGGPKSDFEKPLSLGKSLLHWGINLVAAPGGAIWRKHRRIMGPAFSTKLNQLVWKRTAEIYREMCSAEGWDENDTVEILKTEKLTTQVALLVITGCGFGLKSHWGDPQEGADGQMSLQKALRVFCDRQVVVNFPDWVVKLPFKYFLEYNRAKRMMESWMLKRAAERQELVRSSTPMDALSDDCFTLLIQANEDSEEEGQKLKLTDQELIGNLYILLFAGHETTANTLAATLGFLAVNPEVQDEVLQQILSVVGYDKNPEYEDYAKLSKVLASFYEALRMIPAGYIMLREAITDTILQVPNPVGEEGSVPVAVPKGTIVAVDMIGIQYNERYFDEPMKYKPSRWYDLPVDSELFSAFSVGPRACIGRKFATTEAVSFLTLLLRDWKVEPILDPGQTPEQWKDKVLDAKPALTLTITNVPIRFVRRRHTH